MWVFHICLLAIFLIESVCVSYDIYIYIWFSLSPKKFVLILILSRGNAFDLNKYVGGHLDMCHRSYQSSIFL
jgi:hypothetical protein